MAASVAASGTNDPSRHRAEATLTDGNSRFHLVVSAPGTGSLLQTLTAFDAAMAADDPSAIYPLMNSDVRGASTAARFSQNWRDQEARLGRISSLRRVSVADPRADTAGVTSAIATYTGAVTSPTGSASTQTFDAHFVLQSDGWKLWYTTTR